EALLYVHFVGFLHNDIKVNNVVLDNRKGSRQFNPVLIDFGKSLPLTGLRGPKALSTEKQKKYRKDFPHIAPEIVMGMQGQSIASDIFSFFYLAEVIFLKAKLGPLPEVLQRALDSDPARRPNLKEILDLL
ncbi:hypothetical protein OS493_028533, partial [Desmophyllum pertusum]